MDQLRLRLLGSPQIYLGEHALIDTLRNKAQALFFYLVVTKGMHTRDTLASLFWRDMPDQQARKNLRNILPDLRKQLGAHLIITRQTIGFNVQAPYWLDVDALKATSSTLTLDALQQSTELYRGDFLTDFYVREAPAFEDWALEQREYLREVVIQKLDALIQLCLEQGHTDLGVRASRQLLVIEPWRETAHQQLMALLVRSGQRSAAIEQYEICRAILAVEFDVEPVAKTVALYEQIKTGESQATANALRPQLSQTQTNIAASSQLPTFLQTDVSNTEVSTAFSFTARADELAYLETFLARVTPSANKVDCATGQPPPTAFVVGEAGSGKTALVNEFAQRAQASLDTLIVVSSNCNARAGNGAPYLPFAEILRLLTGEVESALSIGTISLETARRLWTLIPTTISALLKSGPDLITCFFAGPDLLARAKVSLAESDLMLTQPPQWLEDLEQLLEQKSFLGNKNVFHPEIAADQTLLAQSSIFQQITDVLRTLAKKYPLLIIIDDLQWADTASLNLLFHLARRVSDDRLLIVGTYRPDMPASSPIDDTLASPLGLSPSIDRRHPLNAIVQDLGRYFGHIQLNLDQETVAEKRHFIDALLDSQPNQLDDGFRQALFHHTDGNPLFTIEMLQMMQAQGALVYNQAAEWVTGPSLNWDILPASIESVIDQQLAHLSPSLRALLAIASVEGATFTLEVVAHVHGVAVEALIWQFSQVLDDQYRLVKIQGPRWAGMQRLSQYSFRHGLFQRYLYNSLNETTRSYLHEAVGEALERLAHEQLDSLTDQLAWHFERAQAWLKACHYLSQAGEQAANQAAYAEAVDYFSRALMLLPKTEYKQRCELLLAREEANYRLGNRQAQAQDLALLADLAQHPDMLQAKTAVSIRRARYIDVVKA